MGKKLESPGERLARSWARLSRLPGGRILFSRLVGRMAPYSGTLGAQVRELEPGFARLELREKRRLQNHLDSVHAVALANLGELTSGLAVLAGTPAGVRGILVALRAEYIKKARGVLTAECRCSVPAVTERTDYEAAAQIRDAAGDVVCRVTASWRLAPS